MAKGKSPFPIRIMYATSLELIDYAESSVRNIERERLDKMILFGENHVWYVIGQYIEHYNLERPHKGLDE